MSNVKERFWLNNEKSALVIIDVQEKLAPAMNDKLNTQLLANIKLLVEGFKTVGQPVIATEQYPKGLGHTLPELAVEDAVEKTAFSCCGEPVFLSALEQSHVTDVVVTGMETHVCVLQTVLDLLDRGFNVHLVSDAVASRFEGDYANALEIARSAGAVVTTTETALFQLVKGAGSDEFKAISRLVRSRTA